MPTDRVVAVAACGHSELCPSCLEGQGSSPSPNPLPLPPGLKFLLGNKPRCARSAWAVVALEERFSGVIQLVLRTPSPQQRCFSEVGVLQASCNGVPWTAYPMVARVHMNWSGGYHCFRFTGSEPSLCTPRLVCDISQSTVNQYDQEICLKSTLLIQTCWCRYRHWPWKSCCHVSWCYPEVKMLGRRRSLRRC